MVVTPRESNAFPCMHPNDVQYVDRGAFTEWQPLSTLQEIVGSDEIMLQLFLYIADRFTE